MLLVLTCALAAATNDWVAEWWPQLPAFFINQPWLVLSIIIAPALAFLYVNIIHDVIIQKYKSAISFPDLAESILEGIKDPVGQKLDNLQFRTASALGMEAHSPAIGDSPLEQFVALTTGLHSVLVQEPECPKLKITLAKLCDDGTFDRFLCSIPKGQYPARSQSFKRKKTTGFYVAAKDRKMVVWKDLKESAKVNRKNPKAARFYVEKERIDHVKGSMICYPIVCTVLDRALCVISVTCEKKNYFNQNNYDRYVYLIEPFADRIRLETYNQMIREKEDDSIS